jgi:hypothetical protein
MKQLPLILALSIFGVIPVTASAKECLETYYQGSNAALLTGRYIDVARDNAVLSWGVRVTASVGPAYADWKNARDKSFRCVKRSGRFKCSAKAQPCRLD